jgi:hypothetical protein
MVYEEISICTDRKNRMIATEATVMQAAINTAVAAFGKDGGRGANKNFAKLIKTLSGDETPALPKMPIK